MLNAHLVLGLRRAQRDMLEFKIAMVYGLHFEYVYAVGLAAEIARTPMSTALAVVKGSTFTVNKYNAEEPKLIRASVVWPAYLDRPKLGDSFDVAMPFEVPDVKKPDPDDMRDLTSEAPQQFEDDLDKEFDGAEIVMVGRTIEEKEDLLEQYRIEYITERRKV